MTFEKRLERGEGASHEDVWRKSDADRGSPSVWNGFGILREPQAGLYFWSGISEREG